MTDTSRVLVAEGFTPPGPGTSTSRRSSVTTLDCFTKPQFLLVIAAVVVFGFFLIASRRTAMVPSKMQYAGEQAYGFVRNSIARDIIGSPDFMKFVPLAGGDLLLHLDQQPLRDHAVHPVPELLPGELRLRPGHLGLAALQRARHLQARLRRLPQARHGAGRHQRPDPAS